MLNYSLHMKWVKRFIKSNIVRCLIFYVNNFKPTLKMDYAQVLILYHVRKTNIKSFRLGCVKFLAKQQLFNDCIPLRMS